LFRKKIELNCYRASNLERNFRFKDTKITKKYKDKKIAVIYGGWSDERQISLKTGDAILNSLLGLKLNAVGLDLTLENFEKQIDKKIIHKFSSPFPKNSTSISKVDYCQIVRDY
jgi:hypothetical protein